MAKFGRPRIQIDQTEFEKLCGLFCSLEDIAAFFNCSPDTIERWCKRTYKETFADVYKKKSALGRSSLRRWQMQAAAKGNISMLIFLGKNYLGQCDTIRTESKADGKLADLIDGLKEPLNDIYEETKGTDEAVADEPPQTPEST